MKVFISWSGESSKKAAVALKDWLPSVIQAIDPFVSSEHVRTGSLWFTEISKELENTNFGILCLTPSNLKEPWILFEAGAISKQLGKSLLTSLLFGGLATSDLECPLSQFQNILPHKEDLRKLISTINKHPDVQKTLSESQLEAAFDMWWPKLEMDIKEINTEAETEAKSKGVKSKRDTDEIMKEILDLSRSTIQQLNVIKEAQSYNSLSSPVWDSGSLRRRASKGDINILPVAGDDIIKPGTGIMSDP